MANEEVIYKVDKTTVLPGGEKMVRGTLLVSNNYYTGGALMNLANDLKAAGSPSVLVGASNGYTFEHNKGTASAGKLIAYEVSMNGLNGAAFVTGGHQMTVNTDLSSINAVFVAIGPAY